MTMSKLDHDIINFFHYIPDRSAAIACLVLFSVFTVLIGSITTYTRTWFMLVVTATAGMEAAGFGCRLALLKSPGYGGFVAMQCLLIISPSFLGLANYIAVGKLMKTLQVRKAAVKAKLVPYLFFGVELLALAVQGAGAGLSVSNTDDPNQQKSTKGTGKVLLLVGLAIQVVFLLGFLAFTLTVQRNPVVVAASRSRPTLRPYLFALYATTVLLCIRNIYRLVEFSQGWYGYLGIHEKFFYCFDTMLVLLCFVLYTAFHPGLLKPTVATRPEAEVNDRGAPAKAGLELV